MRTITKEVQSKISPDEAVNLLRKGNERFVSNLKINRNLLQQVNETSEGQHPFAVIISCMDSRTSSELIFDQGLGDVFSIRVAGNVINTDIIGSAEFGCKVAGAKIVLVLGHTSCGAINGAINNVELGHLPSITRKIQRCIPDLSSEFKKATNSDICEQVTKDNVKLGINDLKSQSQILNKMVEQGEIKIVGGIYDLSTGIVEFIEQ